METTHIFEDYQSLLAMKAGRKCKIKILELLVSQGTNNWRVVGITPKALERFSNQGFSYVTGSGIQRAHVFDRHATFGSLLDNPMTQKNFWEFISERDRTILAVKGEYNSVNFDDVISLPDAGLFPNNDQMILFKSRTVGYRFGLDERDFLMRLHETQE